MDNVTGYQNYYFSTDLKFLTIMYTEVHMQKKQYIHVCGIIQDSQYQSFNIVIILRAWTISLESARCTYEKPLTLCLLCAFCTRTHLYTLVCMYACYIRHAIHWAVTWVVVYVFVTWKPIDKGKGNRRQRRKPAYVSPSVLFFSFSSFFFFSCKRPLLWIKPGDWSYIGLHRQSLWMYEGSKNPILLCVWR